MEAKVGIHWVGGYSRQRRGEQSWRKEVGKNQPKVRGRRSAVR